MPVPTDTFWNISRLNKVFALSAIILLGVMGWATMQDFDKQWRAPQKSGKAWEAALVSEKLIDRDQVEAQAAELDKQIDAKSVEVTQKNEDYKKITGEIAKATAELANLDFRTNTLKAVVGEQLKFLEEAKTNGNKKREKELNAKLDKPQAELADFIEKQAALKALLFERKKQLSKVTFDLDKLRKERTKKTEDRDALKKKLNSLAPQTLIGKVSAIARGDIPLLQFVNPSEAVKQQVIPDVLTDLGGFKTVPAIDRCVTCHVNIDKRDFAEDKVLAYLEEQLSTSRKLDFAAPTGKPGDPTASASRPGAAAMPEFWLKYAVLTAPDVMKKPAIANRLKTLAGTIGKASSLTIDGKPVAAYTLGADAAKKEESDNVAAAVLDAWVRYSKNNDAVSTVGNVSVTIKKDVDEKAVAVPRKAALLVAEDLKNSLSAALSPEKLRTVLDRYRRAMIAEVNVSRKAGGMSQLDPSPVMLAHPRLDLYADIDSKHPMEKIGCTSCHDGSGQETRFILAAHTARPIWVDKSTGAPVLAQQIKPAKPMEAEKPTMSSMLNTVFPEESLIPTDMDDMHLSMGEKAEKPSTRPAEIVAVPEEAPLYPDPVDYIDPITGKKGKAVSQLVHWKDKYESESGQTYERTHHEWDWPMHTPEYLQASCVRCHTGVNDIKEVAPIVYEGRHLFSNLGCVNCHQMDSIPAAEQRRVGTDLRHIGAKLSPAMVNTWIWAPKAFRPTTKMPHFFMLENNSSDEEIRRTRQEARAMTEYLMQTAEPLPPKHSVPSGIVGKVEDGRKAFNTLGCLACHQNLNDPAGEAKRDGKLITRGEAWIVQDLVLGGELAKKLTAETGKAPTSAELSAEATKLYDGMSYNERQLYVLEHLDADRNETGADTYDDAKKTVKPVFMHHGPELSGIGTKLLADRNTSQATAWLYDWLKEPRHYSDYTVMPSLRLSDQQAADLAAYLLDQKRTNNSPDDKWKESLTETDSGKLIELTSLFLRSRYSPKVATERADDITELRGLATDALTTTAISADAAKAKVAAIEAQPNGKDTLRQVFLGKKLISNYGCMQCHAINGMETAASPCANLSDWGQKLVSKLDFGYVDPHKAEGLPEQNLMMVNGMSAHAGSMTKPMKGDEWATPMAKPVTVAWPEVHHTRESWLTQKLRNTRIWDRGKALLDPVRLYENGKMMTDAAGYPMIKDSGKPYDKVKMPTFYLSDREINAIVTFVISNRARLISDRMTTAATSPSAQKIAHGRYLVAEKFNCTSCHLIEGNKPQIQQYWTDDSKIPQFAPPQLRSQGSRVMPAWLYNFFHNVVPIRPTLVNGVRMPSFTATNEEWSAIIAYFNEIGNKESKDLKKDIDPILKWRDAKIAASGLPADETDAADNWFVAPELVASTSRLRSWGVKYKHVSENRVPLFGNVADMAEGYNSVLYRARLTTKAFAAPYPFVETPDTNISPERFKRGEAMFIELDCLKCHTMGPAAPGTAPVAPNLHLTFSRIRRGWAEQWVRHPDVMHKNSPMLQFFSGEKISDPIGQTWGRAQGFADNVIARTNAAYGNTPDEQISLLLDFVYAASARGYNVVPRPAGTPPPSETMEKNGEIKVIPLPPPKPKVVKPVVTDKPAGPTLPPVVKPKVETGTVSGKVMFKGEVPPPEKVDIASVQECDAHHPNGLFKESVVVSPKNELKNVLVSVSSGLSGPFDVPTTPAVIDQKGCQYFPHVLGVMVGQKLVIRNSDDFLHNVHSLSSSNTPFNFGQSKDAGKDMAPFKTPESFRVKCDVHPWMGMNVQVFDHPYFAVTGEDGSYTLPPLPAGTYTLTFWHEKLGTQEKEITVTAGKTADATLTYAP